METNTYTLPAQWITALVNDDYSGLEENDIERLNKWIDRVKPGHCTCPDTEPYFTHGHDENKNEGADVIEAIFVKY